MVTMPDFFFGLDGVSSTLAELYFIFFNFFFQFFFFNFLFYFYFFNFFYYYVRNPDTTPTVKGACYNQLATTLYTPTARQQSRKQTPHAYGSLSAL